MNDKQDKTKPIYGLEKIPDSELLKLSQRELGEYKSYCEELEDKVKELEKKLSEPHPYDQLSKKERIEVSKKMQESVICQTLQAQIKSLKEKNKKLEATNGQLIDRIIELQHIRD
jgi:hypothetical protein